jgi:hypothetical protein
MYMPVQSSEGGLVTAAKPVNRPDSYRRQASSGTKLDCLRCSVLVVNSENFVQSLRHIVCVSVRACL